MKASVTDIESMLTDVASMSLRDLRQWTDDALRADLDRLMSRIDRRDARFAGPQKQRL